MESAACAWTEPARACRALQPMPRPVTVPPRIDVSRCRYRHESCSSCLFSPSPVAGEGAGGWGLEVAVGTRNEAALPGLPCASSGRPQPQGYASLYNDLSAAPAPRQTIRAPIKPRGAPEKCHGLRGSGPDHQVVLAADTNIHLAGDQGEAKRL